MESAPSCCPCGRVHILKRGKIRAFYRRGHPRGDGARSFRLMISAAGWGGHLATVGALARARTRGDASRNRAGLEIDCNWAAVRLRHDVLEGSMAIGSAARRSGRSSPSSRCGPPRCGCLGSRSPCRRHPRHAQGAVIPGLLVLLAVAAVPVVFRWSIARPVPCATIRCGGTAAGSQDGCASCFDTIARSRARYIGAADAHCQGGVRSCVGRGRRESSAATATAATSFAADSASADAVAMPRVLRIFRRCRIRALRAVAA